MTDEQKALQKLIGMFCNAVDNLNDLPVSQEWAAKFAKEGFELLEANDYFRVSRTAPVAVPTERAGDDCANCGGVWAIDKPNACACGNYKPAKFK